jgi:protein PhnA
VNIEITTRLSFGFDFKKNIFDPNYFKMHLEKELQQRSNNKCELCGSEENLSVYEVPNSPTDMPETSILICNTCIEQIEDPEKVEPNHWRCLNDSMWSTVPAVQVMAWRMLNRLKAEGWPQDLLDMMYLDDETKEWAKAGLAENTGKAIIHRDSNGVILEAGDSVVLIKDLKVKGSSMVAKQGTAVRRISLDHENEKYIEGKVDGQQIVIITDFVKKI